ncbi:MAG: cation:proton antiporter [Bryobacterales bacterium]|nr:cation:proton antiporter [Bryobacterales bacterium]
MPELKLLFLQMAVVLLVVRVVSVLFRKAGQPGVVGEMAAGLLLGPSVLGHISPEAMNALFAPGQLGPLYALSQVGLVLFMFLVGLELRPALIRGSARTAILASQASILVPLITGGALAWGLYPRFGGGAGRLPFVLFFGAAMGITAFPVLARILADRKLTNTRVGIFAISCAAVDDLSAWSLLAVITVIAVPDAQGTALPVRFAALLVYVLMMVFPVRSIARRLFPGDELPGLERFRAVLILLLASVWATESLGFHALFGAFLAGVVMPKGGRLEAGLKERVESVTLGLLLPLFFAYTGLRTSVGLLNSVELWLLCALIIVVAVGSKLVVSAAFVRASGMTWRESLAVGVLVNTRGLVELVILNAGLDLRILSPALFSMMVIMALATTLMTAPLIDLVYRPKQAAA